MLHTLVRPALAAVAVLALGSCSSASDLVASAGPTETPSSAPTDPPSPTEPPVEESMPEVDACYLATRAQVEQTSFADEPVSCQDEHTTQTYLVDEFKQLEGGGVGPAALRPVATQRCERAFDDVVGGDQAALDTSLLTWAYFLPSAEEFSDGARWFRCDAYAAAEQGLVPLPGQVEGVLDGGVPDVLARCWTTQFPAESGDPQGRLVSCDRPHAQRAIGIQRLGTLGDPYPGREQLQSVSEQLCRQPVREWLGNPDQWSWGYTYPLMQDWRDGDRFVTCWAVTNA